MKDIKKQIENVESKTIGFDLLIKAETNKYGYDTLDLYLNNSRLCRLDSLTRFERNFILNRLNRVYIDIETRTYKDTQYQVIVVREKDGYDNESIVLDLSYDSRIMLMAILNAGKVL